MKQLTPAWPDALDSVDVVKLRFALDLLSPCMMQPADFLGLGRTLRLIGRQLFDARDATMSQQWETLFQPSVSDDPVARKKFQKPAPAFVLTMPIQGNLSVDTGDRLFLEVLFLGTGTTSIHHFLRSLIHLGQLGLVAGEGRFDVTEVDALQPEGQYSCVWRQKEPVAALTSPVLNLLWMVRKEQIAEQLTIHFATPSRLMRAGKPLRQPRFEQVFPFMLRRVTSMLYAHSALEVCDDPARLLKCSQSIETVSSDLAWQDWRNIAKAKDLAVGGFVGNLDVQGTHLEELFWILAVVSLLGVGKGATYGAGRVDVWHR